MEKIEKTNFPEQNVFFDLGNLPDRPGLEKNKKIELFFRKGSIFFFQPGPVQEVPLVKKTFFRKKTLFFHKNSPEPGPGSPKRPEKHLGTL